MTDLSLVHCIFPVDSPVNPIHTFASLLITSSYLLHVITFTVIYGVKSATNVTPCIKVCKSVSIKQGVLLSDDLIY